MTLLFEADPTIVVGVTETGLRSVQFWGERKLGTVVYQSCLVSMTDDKHGGGLNIQQECPDSWLSRAWAMYSEFREGRMPEPTHTVKHGFGAATMTEVTP